MKKFPIKCLLFFTFFLLVTLPNPTYAQTDILGESQINPGHPLYFLKSVREAFELKFTKTTNDRALKQLELAGRRIRDVRSLTKTASHDLIQPTLEKYWLNLSELTGLLNLEDEYWAAAVSQQTVLQMNTLLAVYPQISDATAKRSLKTTVYRLVEWEQNLINKLTSLNKFPSAERLKLSRLAGCNFLAKVASSSALNQVEKEVWDERVKKCFEQPQ